jgi:hypothetical protein
MNDYVLVCILLIINGCGWAFTLLKYKHLTNWLKDHAPMTWETYKRLGKCKKS